MYVATRYFKTSKYGEFREGQKVDVPADAIAAWKKSGLIREAKEPERPLGAGKKSPSSRPGRASRATTATESAIGEIKELDEASSPSTFLSESPDAPMSSTQPTSNGGETTT